ncbi:uncharacterized protein LOC134655197 [Cydia amplana]|uniref:uncharacterized protein LOC134655197 n=1 Tax=Cydia amplana TaxID=1869771 RepID=UPI002FE6704E
MCQNYTFSYHGSTGRLLICSRRARGRCQARVKFNAKGEVVYANHEHNHPPPQLHRTSDGQYKTLEYLTLNSGRQIIMYQGFTFCYHQRGTSLVILTILNSLTIISDTLEYPTLNSGRQIIMYEGFTFCYHQRGTSLVILTILNSLTIISDTLEYLTLNSGRQIIMYQGFTFCYHQRGTNRLQCSKKITNRCEARLKLDDHGVITFADTRHNHPPPIYMKSDCGTYGRVRIRRK